MHDDIPRLLGEDACALPAFARAIPKVEIGRLLDALAAIDMDQGSFFEAMSRTRYDARIEMRRRSKPNEKKKE